MNIPEALQAVTGQASQYLRQVPVQFKKLHIFLDTPSSHANGKKPRAQAPFQVRMGMFRGFEFQVANEVVYSNGSHECATSRQVWFVEATLRHIVVLSVG